MSKDNCLICQGGAIGMNPIALGELRTWHDKGHPQGSDMVSYSLKPTWTHTKSAQLTEATQERKDISDE